MKTIVLNMIVKNETQILKRCFDSVSAYIDYWVIVDTGSTDGTQDFIKEYFKEKGIKGELHEEPWVNFGYNRNHALKLAHNKGDYILLTDSDMQLVVTDLDFKNKLESDMYLITQGNQAFVYHNVRLIKASNDYEYVGVTHEYLDCKKPNHSKTNATGLHFDDYADGKNRADKFKRDIKLLEDGLLDLSKSDNEIYASNLSANEKHNKLGTNHQLRIRYKFYLGQSYKDDGNFEKAIEIYTERGNMGGWIEEVFFSFMQVAKCYEIQKDWNNALKFYLEAYQRHSLRAEPIYEIAKYYRTTGKNNLAYMFGNIGIKIPFPNSDSLFISKDVYDYQFLYELMISSYYVSEFKRGQLAAEMLLHKKNIPAFIKDSGSYNLIYYAEPLSSMVSNIHKQELRVNKTKDNYNICNPSILLRSDGKYVINIREVSYNFHIDENYYQYDKTIDTNNHICVIDNKNINNLSHILKTTVVTEPNCTIEKTDCYITGYEDMRLIEFKNTTYALCTSMITNPNKLNEMLLCRFDNEFKIDKTIRLKGYGNDICQKNWVPFVSDNDELLILYSNEPTIILRPDLETGLCDVVSCKENQDYDFSTYRGGSQLVRHTYKGISGYLYLIHQIGYHQLPNNKHRRYYYHRFVFMDLKYNIVDMSKLFYLVEKTIEFVSGMTKDHTGTNLLITLGVEDKKAFLLKVSIEDVMNLLSLKSDMSKF